MDQISGRSRILGEAAGESLATSGSLAPLLAAAPTVCSMIIRPPLRVSIWLKNFSRQMTTFALESERSVRPSEPMALHVAELNMELGSLSARQTQTTSAA